MTKATRAHLAQVARDRALAPFHGAVEGRKSNLGPIVAPFPTWSVAEADGLWCAAFVYYCCREAGFEFPIRPKECRTCHLAGCIAWEEWAMGDSRIEYHRGDGFRPEPGDIVLYDRVFENGEHDHMGIVLENRGQTILTAEGNVNNVSRLVERPLDEHIRSYIRLPDGFRYEAAMQYEIMPCEESDIAYIWERGFEGMPVAENAREETLVFKVSDEQGAIVGGCVLDIDETKTAEFERLWVDERYRRQGMGSALIRAAEQAAREKGCRTMVNAYTFEFQAARRLFERQGFRLIGTVQDWPKGHESYTLIKNLDGHTKTGAVDHAGFEIKLGSEADGEIINHRLEAYNRTFAPRSHEYLDLDRKVVNDAGGIIAGCVAGVSGWDTLHIDAFWVDEPCRGQGVGARLLDEIEREAREKGAYLATTAGVDLQTAFFTEHGYEISVVFEDQPKWYVMHKHL